MITERPKSAIEKPKVVFEESADPLETAEARARHEQFGRNAAWLHAHASEIYSKHRCQCICIAGAELFVAETAREALVLATAKHPNDKGRFVHYMPYDKLHRVYGHSAGHPTKTPVNWLD